MKHLLRICLLLALVACQREVPYVYEEGEIQPGEEVMFATSLPGTPATRALDPSMYKPVAKDYEFHVEMYEQDIDDALGSAIYQPEKTVTSAGDPPVETTTYDTYGTLVVKTGTAPLYWPGNAKKYGFKATAGTTTLEADQSSDEKLLAQDRLLGYACNPATDDEGVMYYRTPKEWKAANVGQGLSSANEYKKIPLYLQHQRSLITVILKAGEGVNRDDLAYAKAQNNIQTRIFGYDGSSPTPLAIQPLASATTVNYTSSDFGTVASDVESTQYTAVVEPFNYLTNATGSVIAEIHLSGQRFTFCAANDFQYEASQHSEMEGHAAAVTHMAGYNLMAGKHLVITATLGRASRKILITAYVEDWTETVTTSIVDDYGQAGDPIQINTRQQLYEFLTDETKNKQGNVAIIVPNSINLEKNGDEDCAWNYSGLTLNCTLNMAGATFKTNHAVFSTISASGNLVNGTIAVGNATVDAAVATNNYGTITRVNVLPRDANGNDSNGKASSAGVAVTNYGTIVECTSELPVYGTVSDTFVGGIAAHSVYASGTGTTMPVIDGCHVNARVDGVDGVKGGGIVGEANGRVTGCNFEYGITLMQDATNFKNIIQAKAVSDKTLRADFNSWPTVAVNNAVVSTNANNTPEDARYDAVIDCEAELALLLISYNVSGKVYRLSNSFAVTKTGGWNYGQKDDDLSISNQGNVFFKLDGNEKTITTDAMLFGNIQGEIKDLTIRLSDNLIAVPDEQGDAIAPLGYSVYGPTAKISNIKVKAGNYRIQASTPGGIVVWAYGGATIENCQCKASIQIWINTLGEDAKIYAGGIAACAAKATFTRCTFHSADGTLFRNIASTYDGDSEVETAPTPGIFFGGILGGTAPKGNPEAEKPSVLLTDCTSWLNAASGQAYKGAIVGYAEYADGTNMVNGIADGCQGNWWSQSSVAIGTRINGKTEEQIIGKRNAVAPAQDTNY